MAGATLGSVSIGAERVRGLSVGANATIDLHLHVSPLIGIGGGNFATFVPGQVADLAMELDDAGLRVGCESELSWCVGVKF